MTDHWFHLPPPPRSHLTPAPSSPFPPSPRLKAASSTKTDANYGRANAHSASTSGGDVWRQPGLQETSAGPQVNQGGPGVD